MRSIFSYQFGKQFNVLLLLKRRSAPSRFVNNRLFLRIVSDCIAAWMFEVRRDKCTLIENSKSSWSVVKRNDSCKLSILVHVSTRERISKNVPIIEVCNTIT